MARHRNNQRYFADDDDDIIDAEDELAELNLIASKQESTFKFAFSILFLFPTPLFIFLPYCKRNASLSLLSLLSIVLSTCIVYYGEKLNRRSFNALQGINSIASTGVLVMAYIKHKPWRGYDYVWILALVTAVISMIISQWFRQTRNDIETLRQLKQR